MPPAAAEETTPRQSSDTLQVASAGDEHQLLLSSAFKSLYRRYFKKLVAGLRASYGAGPPDPEDIAQTAFEKLGRRGRLDDIQDPEGYLWIAARNTVLTEKRREMVRNANEDEVSRHFFGESCDTFEPQRVLSAKQQLKLVMDTLHHMPERRRRIFILNRVHGLSPAKAGQRCGVSRTAAVRHIAIATQLINEALLAPEHSAVAESQ